MEWVPDVEFPLDDGTLRGIDLVHFWNRHSLLVLAINRQPILCEARCCEGYDVDGEFHYGKHAILNSFTSRAGPAHS